MEDICSQGGKETVPARLPSNDIGNRLRALSTDSNDDVIK